MRNENTTMSSNTPFLMIIAILLHWAVPGNVAIGAEILACADNKSGTLRVVSSLAECKTNKESPLSWNADGAQGSQGEEGPEGPAGPAGPQGAAAPTIQFVGLGNPTAGNEGIDSLNKACSDNFTGARMCSSTDVLNSPVIQTFSTAPWVRPDIVAVDANGIAVDASGLAFSPQALSCDGWKNGTGFTGLALVINGGFNILSCDTTRNVACCGLVD